VVLYNRHRVIVRAHSHISSNASTCIQGSASGELLEERGCIIDTVPKLSLPGEGRQAACAAKSSQLMPTRWGCWQGERSPRSAGAIGAIPHMPEVKSTRIHDGVRFIE
jgi:hypothetical protein